MTENSNDSGGKAPRTCLCGCLSPLPSPVGDTIDPGVFATDACALRWARKDAGNQFDRGELSWCDDCGRAFFWDGGENDCGHCAGRKHTVRVTLDVVLSADSPDAAVDVARVLAGNTSTDWLDCPSVTDSSVVIVVALAPPADGT